MAEPLTQEQKNQVLFMQLVVMFQSAAMQQMGKVMNPITQKIERDLQQAHLSIDILGMLEEKTKSNLSEEEKHFLSHVLFELRMNYVDETKKEQGEKPGEEKEEERSSREREEEKPGEEKEAEEPSEESNA